MDSNSTSREARQRLDNLFNAGYVSSFLFFYNLIVLMNVLLHSFRMRVQVAYVWFYLGRSFTNQASRD